MSVNWRFQTRWSIVILLLIMVPILIRLGFWQLQRADEKLELQDTFQQRQLQTPLSVAELDAAMDKTGSAAIAHRKVRFAGELDGSRTILLDNRIQGGVPGFEVLQLLRIDGQPGLLVNRGWIRGNADRSQLPPVPVLTGWHEFEASIYVPPGKPVVLKADNLSPQWPVVVQWLDIEQISSLLEQPLFPYSLRLDAGQPASLEIAWQPINTQPEKHQGYAIQWFAMAAAIVGFWLYSSLSRVDNETGGRS